MIRARRIGVRFMVLVPLLSTLAAVGGAAMCRLAGWEAHPNDLCLAVVVSVVAAEISATPIVLFAGSDSGASAQAGLASLVALMLLTVMLAAGATAFNLVQKREAFVGWLLVFSWLAVVEISWTAVAIVRAASLQRKTG